MENSVSELAKDWLTIIDSLWGVGGAIVVTGLVMYRRLRKQQTLSSVQLRGLSDQLQGVTAAVERLEFENSELLEKYNQLKEHALHLIVEELEASQNLSQKELAEERLCLCFSYLQPLIGRACEHVASIFLEKFYSSSDAAFLNQADFLARAGGFLETAEPRRSRLGLEIAIAVAANNGAVGSGKSCDELWDEVVEFFDASAAIADAESRFMALNKRGTELRNEGRYEVAGAALRAACRIAEKHFGAEDMRTLTSLNNVATNYSDRKMQAQARMVYEELSERYFSAAGFIDENVFKVRLAICQCDRILKGEEAVISKLEDLLKDGFERFGDGNRWVLKAQNSLAVCLQTLGRTQEAEELYRATIESEENLFGVCHANPLSTRTNLATLLMSSDRCAEGLDELRSVIAERKRLHGAAHPITLSLQDLLELYEKRKEQE